MGAVQRFFLQEVQMGEELLATGDIQNGVEHLSLAVAVCGQPHSLLSVLQQTLPPQIPASATELGRGSAEGQDARQFQHDELHDERTWRNGWRTCREQRKQPRGRGCRIICLCVYVVWWVTAQAVSCNAIENLAV